MIQIVIASERYPIDNILVHIRVFLKDKSSYANISNLKTDEFGSILLTDDLIKESLVSAEFEDITGFGLSFLNIKTIEEFRQSYKRFETISTSEIVNELIHRGFKKGEIESIAKTTLIELGNQSKMISFYETCNNHLVPNISFENEFKFDLTKTKVILNLESALKT